MARNILLALCLLLIPVAVVGMHSHAIAVPDRDQASPSIQVSPSPVGPGQTTTAYGFNFCGAADCSSVTITLDGQVLGSVAAKPDGTFQFPFTAAMIPDQYTVAATQIASDGSQLSASYGLVVLPADAPPGTTPITEATPTPPIADVPPTTPSAELTPSSTATMPQATATRPAATPTETISPEPAPTTNGDAERAKSDDSSLSTWLLIVGGVALAALAVGGGVYLLKRIQR